jgi:hypothetical protein
MSIQRWVACDDLIGTDGRPMKIHRSRIRTTFHSLRDKATWIGHLRVMIDPTTPGESKATITWPPPHRPKHRAAEAIVEDAQHDLLRRPYPPTIVTALRSCP